MSDTSISFKLESGKHQHGQTENWDDIIGHKNITIVTFVFSSILIEDEYHWPRAMPLIVL